MTTRGADGIPKPTDREEPRGGAAVVGAAGRVLLVALALTAVACGSSVSGPPGEGGGGAGAGGGDGGSFVGCEGLDDAYLLNGAGHYPAPGTRPWVLLQEDGETCRAIVGCEGFSAFPYDVSISSGSLTARPAGQPAVGAHLAPTQYTLAEWTRIVIRRNGSTPRSDGSASITVHWIEQGIVQDTHQEEVETDVRPADGGLITAPTDVLPWRTLPVTTNRPVERLASNLTIPAGDWEVVDVVDAGAVGVGRAELSFHGSWDDVRGQQQTVAPVDGLVDLSGTGVSTAPARFTVIDVGAAIPEHDLADPSTLASWGDVQDYNIGECATLGCVSIRGECHAYAGIAGQLDTTGMTEVVLAMRLLNTAQGYQVPYYWRIEVVAEDGTARPQTAGGDWPDQEIHEWTYDVGGHAKVGFAIEASKRCDGYGGRLAVERVFAR